MKLTFGEERDAGPILGLTVDSCGVMFNAPLLGEISYARPHSRRGAPQGQWFWITPAMMRAQADHEARRREDRGSSGASSAQGSVRTSRSRL